MLPTTTTSTAPISAPGSRLVRAPPSQLLHVDHISEAADPMTRHNAIDPAPICLRAAEVRSGFAADNCRSSVGFDGFNLAQADEQAVSADLCPRG